MTIENALSDFLIEQQIRGNTQKTVQYYSLSVGLYARFAGSDTPLKEITLNSLRTYYLHLSGRNISSTTIQTYIRALRSFLTWCYQQEYIPVNLSEKFRLPKAQRKAIDVLTDSEVQRLLFCFNLRYLIHLRNYCMCSLMLASTLSWLFICFRGNTPVRPFIGTVQAYFFYLLFRVASPRIPRRSPLEFLVFQGLVVMLLFHIWLLCFVLFRFLLRLRVV